jgi:hypothetical protein
MGITGGIVAGTAIQHVGSVHSFQDIIAGAAGEAVDKFVADQGVIAA